MTPISLYIHIPFCAHKCHYCAFYSSPQNFDHISSYFGSLATQLQLYQAKLSNCQIQSIFFGGGTPSLVDAKYITKLLKTIHKRYNIKSNAEITIECNPETLTQEKLEQYYQSGINRISIGLQAWQNHHLNYLGRTYTNHQFTIVWQLVEKSPFTNTNIDLIFGLPNQTMDEWKQTLDQAIQFNPKHIATYSLMIEKDTTFHRLYKLGKLAKIPEELDRKMYHYAIHQLEKNGYHQYEISNFAKPEHQCQHNLSFWNGGEYIGFGASASSYYNQTITTTIANTKQYISAITNQKIVKTKTYKLTKQQNQLHQLLLHLRLNSGLNIAQFNNQHHTQIIEKYQPSLTKLIKQKLLIKTNQTIKLTSKGKDLENYVAQVLAQC